MQDQLNQLLITVNELQNQINDLKDYSRMALEIENALVARGFFKVNNALASGLLYSVGGTVTVLSGTGVVYMTNNVPSVVTGASKGVYVATISGGSPTNFMQVTNGITTSI